MRYGKKKKPEKIQHLDAHCKFDSRKHEQMLK